MAAIWSGRFGKDTDAQVARFTASIGYDQRLYPYDIQGSVAHVRMLGHAGIIPQQDADAMVRELARIEASLDDGSFDLREDLEDIHMNIEAALIERLGEVGAKVHTGRSRNDQIVTDERLYLRAESELVITALSDLQRALVAVASEHRTVIMPGFTHLQHAQPVLFAHHLLAYVEMFERDKDRLGECRRRLNVLPLGAGALAGSTLPLDREFVAAELGFDSVARNSMDAVADRDFIVEFLADLALIAMHCSRLGEDVVLWASQHFSFIELDDAFCTGSSLMPQKKNPDVAEIVRGKTGRVYGSLFGLLTVLKGLPLTYNRDLQEDKEGLFDAVDTVKLVLATLAPMVATMKVNAELMSDAARNPALMATDLAEWLVGQGVAFRDAHHRVGRFVAYCRERGLELDHVSLEQMRETIPEASGDCLGLFCAQRSVESRNLTGGTAPEQVLRQLRFWEGELATK